MKKKYLAWMAIVMIALTGIFTGCGSSADEAAKEEKASQVDVDLTQMSSTMVYSEVFNMVNEPDDYLGKMIKMEGTFALYYDENTGKDYYACIIQDATACCSQGIEFELSEDYKNPGSLMTEGDTVTVVGEFDQYTEGDLVYYTLRDADLL
jgi:hypothetical protein